MGQNSQGGRVKAWVRRMARVLVLALLLLAVLFGVRCWYAFRDRTPGYRLDLELTPEREAGVFRVGFGRVRITPELEGGRPVYLAGFGANRVAARVQDDLWALACVMDDGRRRVGLVALDAIGFFHDDVVRVRRRLPEAWGLDYVMICSTHNHSTPDLMGLWGPVPWRSGVDPEYLEQVRRACVDALGQAVARLEPAGLVYHHVPCEPQGLLADTRPPEVYDADLRVLQFVAPGTGRTLGSLINWGNHPETPWSGNRDVTADFCGVLRDALERGVREGDQERLPAVGGVHVFVNGAVGGLMTTSPGVTVRDPWSDRAWREPSHEKARALGYQLAARLAPVLLSAREPEERGVVLGVWAQTVEVRVTNWRYWLAGVLGVLDRGYVRWPYVRSEVALIRVGEATLACVPGELYPEIANGGVESPKGADFPVAPVEAPPLRSLMPGRLKLVVGLANDELGYLIPKSQWDERPPFAYDRDRPPYGEINSCGPDAAGVVYEVLARMCRAASW
ncbi:hypothetical protein G4L39_07105 [Limisphaera ngatamarikiensis]|uniref:Neutral/alkaline non-lysosomal ceramidase N-terminal domain-containing protein n=1 Tax=Limisphaera ngatamarikiensis TaxID=1324935 RepID=A0A6M1RUW3_9BACT|nr:hypothetical protein [Limisphaera ngatamarikiensis]NGO39164.1 hypothetical protein [Limisphaera ngatamarikiensis]